MNESTVLGAIFKAHAGCYELSDVPVNERLEVRYDVGVLGDMGSFEEFGTCDSIGNAIEMAEVSNVEWAQSEGYMPHPIVWSVFPKRPGYVMEGRTRGSFNEGGEIEDVVYLIRVKEG